MDNEQDQPEPVHDPPGNRGHVRRRHFDALDRDRGRHEHSRARRQCLRRGGRHRLHAAGGRAASQRSGRRRAGDPARYAARQDRGDLRAGACAGRRDDRALQEPRPRSRARLGAVGHVCPRHVRHLDAAAARLRHRRSRNRARAGNLLCRTRPSTGRARQRHHRDGRGAVPRPLADVGRGLSARRQGAGDRHDVHQQDAGRDLQARARGGEERGRQARGADRTRAQDVE